MSQTATDCEAVDEGEEEEQLTEAVDEGEEEELSVELRRKRQPPTVAVAMQLIRAASMRRKRRKSADLSCSNPKYHGTDAAASSEAPAASSEAPAASSEAPEAPAASSEAPAEAQLVTAEAELVSAQLMSPSGKTLQLVAAEPDTQEPSPAKVKGAQETEREADYRSVKTSSMKRSLANMELPGEVFGNLELFDFVIYIYIYIYITYCYLYMYT